MKTREILLLIVKLIVGGICLIALALFVSGSWFDSPPATNKTSPSSSSASVSEFTEPLEYLAGGDSYSGGNGNSDYETGTDVGDVTLPSYNLCHRSAHGYPQVIAREMGAAVTLTNVACNGSMISDITASNHLFPSVPPQIDAVTPDTDVVTITIGGNDVDFAKIMTLCLLEKADGASCQSRFGPNLDDALSSIDSSYARAIREIRRIAPDARIIVTGYPLFFSEDQSEECNVEAGKFGLSPGDIGWVNSKIKELNTQISEAAYTTDSAYVSVTEAFEGHDICAPENKRWINGFGDGDIQGWLHPNLAGQEAYAEALKPFISPN